MAAHYRAAVDSPEDKAWLAASIANAVIDPFFGVPMLINDYVFNPLLGELAEQQDNFRNQQYAAERERNRVMAEYRRLHPEGTAQNTLNNLRAEQQGKIELARMRASIIPVLLTQQNVDDNLTATAARIKSNAETLGKYQQSYSQNMIANNTAQYNARQAAINQQSRQQLSGLQAQIAATQAQSAQNANTQRQTQEAYTNAIGSNKSMYQALQGSYQNNIAKSQSILSNEQQILEQRKRLDDQLHAQAAQTQATRAAQLAEAKAKTSPPITSASRLPPTVSLPYH